MTDHARISEIGRYVKRKAKEGKARFRWYDSGKELVIGVSHEDGTWFVWRCPDARLVASGEAEP